MPSYHGLADSKCGTSCQKRTLLLLLAIAVVPAYACAQGSTIPSNEADNSTCRGCNPQFKVVARSGDAFHEQRTFSHFHFSGPVQYVRQNTSGVPHAHGALEARLDFHAAYASDHMSFSLEARKDPPEIQEGNGNSPSATTGSPGHIFWVVPAFKVNYAGKFEPLTPKEKFQEWAQGAYDPLGLGVGAFEAGVLEHSSTDGFCGYGKDFAGYMECFGSAELDSNISSFIGDYVLTVAFHQDPRYFRLGKGPFARRVFYAISRVFVTYDDRGHTVVYSSALTGTVAAAGLSNLYYPQQDRGFGLTLSRIGLDLANTALYNAAAEFWPDIQSGLHHVL